MLIVPIDASAKTLGDLIKELDALSAELNRNKQTKQLTEKQIADINNNIKNINADIANMQKEMSRINNEITVLNDNIERKNKEIKDLLNFVQVSNGESAYLEYAMGAKTFTDFIYRMAVSEQMANYNANLIKQYDEMIENNRNKNDEMTSFTKQLAVKQDSLSVELNKLGKELTTITNIRISLEEEIKLQRDAIKLYQELGCKTYEDIKTCGRNKLPPGTAFFRPIVSGRVTSEFGNRCFPIHGGVTCDFHNGIDFASSSNVPIYAASDGMVIATSRSSCGGNMVYVHHNIKGKYYTTLYAHLKSISVSPKQVVTKNTVIGIMGGDASTWGWDRCSSGRHLHFQIASGLYLKDYYYWNTFTDRSFNPRNIINIAKGGNWFTDRLTKY